MLKCMPNGRHPPDLKPCISTCCKPAGQCVRSRGQGAFKEATCRPAAHVPLKARLRCQPPWAGDPSCEATPLSCLVKQQHALVPAVLQLCKATSCQLH